MGRSNARKWKAVPIIALMAFVAIIVFSIFKFYPRSYSEIIEKNARKFDLPESLVYAVVKAESGYNPNAVSRKGAKGLMQIMDQTGEWGFLELGFDGTFSPEMLYKPEINVEIGCWYLSKLIGQFGSQDTALAAYNAGSGNVNSWLKNPDYYDGETLYNIPYSETRAYVKTVNANKKIYETLRGIKG